MFTPFHKFDMPFCCHGKPSLKIYISAFGLDVFFFFFYLTGLEPVAPRARFKCVWVLKDFCAAKPCDRIVSFQVLEPSLEPKESPKEKQKTDKS